MDLPSSELTSIFDEALCNCWGQADALFAVCMARAGRGEKNGFEAAKQAAKHPKCCILIQVMEVGAALPSVHAFVALRLAGGQFRICQAMQSQNRRMEQVKSFLDNEFHHHLSCLQHALRRRRKLPYAEVRELETFCGDLSDCFQDNSAVSVKVMSVGW